MHQQNAGDRQNNHKKKTGQTQPLVESSGWFEIEGAQGDSGPFFFGIIAKPNRSYPSISFSSRERT